MMMAHSPVSLSRYPYSRSYLSPLVSPFNIFQPPLSSHSSLINIQSLFFLLSLLVSMLKHSLAIFVLHSDPPRFPHLPSLYSAMIWSSHPPQIFLICSTHIFPLWSTMIAPLMLCSYCSDMVFLLGLTWLAQISSIFCSSGTSNFS